MEEGRRFREEWMRKYGSHTVIGEKRDMHRLTSSLVFLYAVNRRNACAVE